MVGLRYLPLCWVRALLLIAFALGMAMLLTGRAFAEPKAQAVSGDSRIVLTDEPCKLEAIKNLPHRAMWEEKGKTFEGCYGVHPQFPIAMFYFEDRTVVVVPVQLFERLLRM